MSPDVQECARSTTSVVPETGTERPGSAQSWRCRDKVLALSDRPLIMGILNVTPDSFSDGGQFDVTGRAVARGLAMIEEGADIIDVGGESTRPGAADVDLQEELDRVIPVIRELRGQTDIPLSVDTMKAGVARQALAAGADIVNDVSALTHDPGMPQAALEGNAGVVLMHMRGTPCTMQKEPRYENVVEDVTVYLESRVDVLLGTGFRKDALAIDPGIGFGKTVDHNLELLAHLPVLGRSGVPLVIGLSRKSFLGKLTGRKVHDRLAGSLAGLVFCILNGAHIMRVHDVKESVDAVKLAQSLKRKRNGVG